VVPDSLTDKVGRPGRRGKRNIGDGKIFIHPWTRRSGSARGGDESAL